MIDDEGMRRVESILRDVADTEILPRFCRLAAADIAEKNGPNDLVTVADRAAERALSAALPAVLPGSVVVGEEAVADDPTLLKELEGGSPVWIVDPIDGTANFATDNPRFSTLVALAHEGRLLASWTYAPVLDVMGVARTGGGAYVDGHRVRVAEPRPDLRHLDVSLCHPTWWTPADRIRFNALAGHPIALTYFDMSGLEYLELAAGRRTAMILNWQHPWDHAAGMLLHAEAGGHTCTGAGLPYSVTGGNTLPIVVAPDPDTAARLHEAMRP